jgi:hypothetical protein
MNRGGSQPSASSDGLTWSRLSPKPQWTKAVALASCRLRSASPTTWAVWAVCSSATMRMPCARQALRKLRRYVSPTSDCSTRAPTSVWPPLARSSAQKIGSSVSDPWGSEKVHSPSQSSLPVMLRAGTWKRCSIASRVGTQLSVMPGP